MQEAQEIIMLLQVLIASAAIPRAIYCYFKWKTDDDQSGMYKRRFKNLIAFVAIAEFLSSLLFLVKDYVT